MTARAVSKHRRVCGQNYGQIPVLAQKKSPVTGMVTGLFTVLHDQFRYTLKIGKNESWSGFELFHLYFFAIDCPW